MEVISPPRTVARASIAPIIGGVVVGTLFVAIGLVIAYVAFATPFLTWLLPARRPDTSAVIAGMMVWSIAFVAPAALILLGTTRLARLLGTARRRMPRRSAYQLAFRDLPEDVILARGLTLPDGRGISDVLVGPFGAAVIRELPSERATRIRNGHWELRGPRSWIPLENPLDRATRDAERVRRWLGHDDTDFIVKAYAAVVGPPSTTVVRTPGCAVLTPDQIREWVTTLPPQRTLTPGRRERMLELIREAAV